MNLLSRYIGWLSIEIVKKTVRCFWAARTGRPKSPRRASDRASGVLLQPIPGPLELEYDSRITVSTLQIVNRCPAWLRLRVLAHPQTSGGGGGAGLQRVSGVAVSYQLRPRGAES